MSTGEIDLSSIDEGHLDVGHQLERITGGDDECPGFAGVEGSQSITLADYLRCIERDGSQGDIAWQSVRGGCGGMVRRFLTWAGRSRGAMQNVIPASCRRAGNSCGEWGEMSRYGYAMDTPQDHRDIMLDEEIGHPISLLATEDDDIEIPLRGPCHGALDLAAVEALIRSGVSPTMASLIASYRISGFMLGSCSSRCSSSRHRRRIRRSDGSDPPLDSIRHHAFAMSHREAIPRREPPRDRSQDPRASIHPNGLPCFCPATFLHLDSRRL